MRALLYGQKYIREPFGFSNFYDVVDEMLHMLYTNVRVVFIVSRFASQQISILTRRRPKKWGMEEKYYMIPKLRHEKINME